jgi:glycine cleavage system H protein
MNAQSDVKTDRLYTAEHEWARAESKETSVGISSFAVAELGDITLVDIVVRVGDRLEARQVFGTVESVKTLSDLFSPVTGTVTAINESLNEHPEILNEDPWEKGWMIRIAADPAAPPTSLLDASAYRALLESSEH